MPLPLPLPELDEVPEFSEDDPPLELGVDVVALPRLLLGVALLALLSLLLVDLVLLLDPDWPALLVLLAAGRAVARVAAV